jgi:hypothetical protein
MPARPPAPVPASQADSLRAASLRPCSRAVAASIQAPKTHSLSNHARQRSTVPASSPAVPSPSNSPTSLLTGLRVARMQQVPRGRLEAGRARGVMQNYTAGWPACGACAMRSAAQTGPPPLCKAGARAGGCGGSRGVAGCGP